ncbi:MAG: Hsp20/alpha crystallin family protein [Candidatus Polarisedimenticolia bacterium]
MEHSFGPYLEIARIQSEMNKLFDVLLEMKEEADGSQASAWIPSVDVCQTAQGLILRAELPGVPVESLRLSALGGALIIKGERPRTQPPAKAKFHCMERLGGKFRRVVPLGTPINTRDARATMRNGVLEVFFPRVSNRRGEEVVIPVTQLEEAR